MGTEPTAADIDKLLDLPDEEFQKLSGIPTQTTVSTEEKPSEETPAEKPQEVEEKVDVEEKKEETPAEPEEKTPEASKLADPAKNTGPDAFKEPEKKNPVVPVTEVKPQEKKDEKLTEEAKNKPSKDEPKKEDDQNSEMYKEFYAKILAPFKANGNTIQLTSADEVIRLMQQGANYTKKLQAMQPQKKILMMLENNGLLDEGKLGFLIDLDKKNPEAIKKLLNDAKIDPIEFDTTAPIKYQSGSHAVSDQEAVVANSIEDLQMQEGGQETLQSINKWDAASKKVLWEQPELLSIIHSQRVNGIYGKIQAEVEKRKTLGILPVTTGFLQAYKMVGDELAARGAFQPTAPPTAAPKPAGSGVPVAVRPAKTPTQKTDDTRVKAAAPTRTAPKTTQVSTNYLAMSDEDFLKMLPPR